MGEEPPGISETQQNIKAPEINIIKKVDKNKEDDASQMQLDFE